MPLSPATRRKVRTERGGKRGSKGEKRMRTVCRGGMAGRGRGGMAERGGEGWQAG